MRQVVKDGEFKMIRGKSNRFEKANKPTLPSPRNGNQWLHEICCIDASWPQHVADVWSVFGISDVSAVPAFCIIYALVAWGSRRVRPNAVGRPFS
jgi:hypothetical protein